ERDILNARIRFIYHVTVQKPGDLETGWKRFNNLRDLIPQLKDATESAQVEALRQPTNRLEADFKTYEIGLNNILEQVAAGRNTEPAFASVLEGWARMGGQLVDTASELDRAAAEQVQLELAEHS